MTAFSLGEIYSAGVTQEELDYIAANPATVLARTRAMRDVAPGSEDMSSAVSAVRDLKFPGLQDIIDSWRTNVGITFTEEELLPINGPLDFMEVLQTKLVGLNAGDVRYHGTTTPAQIKARFVTLRESLRQDG